MCWIYYRFVYLCRALTFKSGDTARFAEIYKHVTDLKKESAKREQERKDYADLVVQERLVEVKGKRPVRLLEVQVRPSVDGKRGVGDLEVHTNGLRYVSQVRNDQRVGMFLYMSCCVDHFFPHSYLSLAPLTRTSFGRHPIRQYPAHVLPAL